MYTKPHLLQLLLVQALSSMWKSLVHILTGYVLRNELTQVPLGDPQCIHRYLHYDLRRVSSSDFEWVNWNGEDWRS